MRPRFRRNIKDSIIATSVKISAAKPIGVRTCNIIRNRQRFWVSGGKTYRLETCFICNPVACARPKYASAELYIWAYRHTHTSTDDASHAGQNLRVSVPGKTRRHLPIPNPTHQYFILAHAVKNRMCDRAHRTPIESELSDHYC